ncbi:MAG TPA: hypothetical protein VKZ18_11805 [Polyangia bacterium]|nr:hypothetical protein [Polyangia bacterium]
MGRAVVLALALSLEVAGPAAAQADAAPPADTDASQPLVVMPNSAPASEGPPPSTPPGPPPRALDSARTPMPDRLANDHWMQYFQVAPQTPPIPEGGGANRVGLIKGVKSGAPADQPRDSVTRTPEDQFAPPPAADTRTP